MKDLVLPFLQKYQFWMESQDIYDGSHSNFFWIKGTHAKCTYRYMILSILTNKICTAANSGPNQLPPQKQQNENNDTNQSTTATSIMDTTNVEPEEFDIDITPHQPSCDGSKDDPYSTKPLELSVNEHNLLIECVTCDDHFTLQIYSKKVNYRYNNTTYSTNALIGTVGNKYRDVLSKIISSLPCNCLGGLKYIILFSIHRDIGPEEYVTLLEQNKLFHEKTSIISLYDFDETTFQERLVYPNFDEGDDNDPWFGPVADFFCNCKVISIEPTSDSNTTGCYLLIVPTAQRDGIQNEITQLFGNNSAMIGDKKHTWRKKCRDKFGNNPNVGYQRHYRSTSNTTHNSVARY